MVGSGEAPRLSGMKTQSRGPLGAVCQREGWCECRVEGLAPASCSGCVCEVSPVGAPPVPVRGTPTSPLLVCLGAGTLGSPVSDWSSAPAVLGKAGRPQSARQLGLWTPEPAPRHGPLPCLSPCPSPCLPVSISLFSVSLDSPGLTSGERVIPFRFCSYLVQGLN